MSFHRRNGGRIGSVLSDLSGVIDNQLAHQNTGQLFAFTTFTFTNAGATGTSGPTLASCQTAYNTTTYPWLTNTAYFNVTGGIQYWTVPVSGTYTITSIGAKGGTVSASFVGGNGARMIGDFSLTAGTIIAILVGQQGTQSPLNTGNKGGGGGTFVWNNALGSSGLLIAAGGGGGSQASANGVAASISTSGTVQGNAAGTAGTAGNGTVNGAGWLTNGTLGTSAGVVAALSPLNGGTGGDGYSSTHVGGFGGGGGGGGAPSTTSAAGGGGGYSGGAGAGTVSSGGGGGSYNGGSNQSNTANIGTGMGSVIITKI